MTWPPSLSWKRECSVGDNNSYLSGQAQAVRNVEPALGPTSYVAYQQWLKASTPQSQPSKWLPVSAGAMHNRWRFGWLPSHAPSKFGYKLPLLPLCL